MYLAIQTVSRGAQHAVAEPVLDQAGRQPEDLGGALVAQVLHERVDRLHQDAQAPLGERADEAVVREIVDTHVDVAGQEHAAQVVAAGAERREVVRRVEHQALDLAVALS
jgi:hypothetical protein